LQIIQTLFTFDHLSEQLLEEARHLPAAVVVPVQVCAARRQHHLLLLHLGLLAGRIGRTFTQRSRDGTGGQFFLWVFGPGQLTSFHFILMKLDFISQPSS